MTAGFSQVVFANPKRMLMLMFLMLSLFVAVPIFVVAVAVLLLMLLRLLFLFMCCGFWAIDFVAGAAGIWIEEAITGF